MKNIRCCAVGILCLLLPVLFGSCKKEVVEVPAIDTEEMRSICNLAVMECYYHNIAKTKQTDKVLWGIAGTSEKSYWAEYEAKIKVGVDANQIDIAVEGDTVTIRLPQPKNLTKPNIDEGSMKFFSSEGSKTKITADKRLEALSIANDNMVNVLLENSSLMHNAEKRVKEMLKSYVEQIGEFSGVEYKIKWESKGE